MTLPAGSRLGPYEIVAPIGAGGMGEVFRARDTRLNRDVAIKVLPELFTRDPDRLARFTREAQALAALNHPNIAQIYGVVDLPGDTASALVMELVDGEDLSAIIARGPIPMADALSIARQIAEALEAAHEQGIVHRDLKPGNIKVRSDGTVKVLDFGLAKVSDPLGSSSADAMQSPTFTSPAVTGEGVILGTAAYMSPEQARGKSADARADLWAFGVILYEMLTGRRLFDGAHASDVLAAVLRDGPNWEALPAGTPGNVRTVLRRCLQKDPKLRMRHAGDVRIELTDADRADPAPIAVPATRRSRGLAFTGVALVIALAAATGAFVAGRRSVPVPEPRVVKWIVPQESGDQDDAWARENVTALSPDGQHLAYVDGARLLIRSLASLESRAVVHAAGLPGMPVWSPDSAHVAFFVEGPSLWRAPLAGGAATKVCDLPAGVVMGIAWRADRSMLVNVGYGPRAAEIFKVDETGGRPEKWPVPGTPAGESPVIFNLRGLPDGSLAYAVNREHDSIRMLQRGDQPGRELAVPSNSGLTYSSGHLLWSQVGANRGIFAVRFDLANGTVTGEPFRVADAGVFPSASADGTLVYSLPRPGQRQLAWVDRDGTPGGRIGQPQDSMWAPSISPDGSRIAVTGVEDSRPSIWMHEIARGAKSRLTLTNSAALDPAWHPTERRLVYQTGGWNLSAVSSDGGDPKMILSAAEPEYSPSWSLDGRYLVFGRFEREGKGDIWMLEHGATEPKPVFNSPFPEESPALSPDARYVAYVSYETGRGEVFVRTFPDGQGKMQLSFGGGTSPRWNPRGGEIFYVESNALMAAPVRTVPALAIGTPKRLFDLEERGATLRQYDTLDGERFVVVRTIRPSRNGVAVVQNWVKEFAR